VVTTPDRWLPAGRMLLAEAAPETLPPATRAAAMMALVVIGLIGVLFIAAILIGGHWVRRQGDFRRGPSVPPDRAPLASPPPGGQTADSQSERDDPSRPGDVGRDGD
jgi:hypothetical protein